MDFARNRLRLVVVLTTLVAIALAMGLSVSGGFRADIETKRGLFGPVRLGVDGAVGAPKQASDKAVQASLPPVPQPAPAAATPPFDGPTAEERALMDELRVAMTGHFRRMTAHLSPEERQLVPALPEVRMPPRHLTKYEMQEIRHDIGRYNESE